jgi:hypothetical protein
MRARLLSLPVILISFLATSSSDLIAQNAPGNMNEYTCSEFISDNKPPLQSTKVLRSLVALSWATGYLTAEKKYTVSFDIGRFKLVSRELGELCRSNPHQLVISAIELL